MATTNIFHVCSIGIDCILCSEGMDLPDLMCPQFEHNFGCFVVAGCCIIYIIEVRRVILINSSFGRHYLSPVVSPESLLGCLCFPLINSQLPTSFVKMMLGYIFMQLMLLHTPLSLKMILINYLCLKTPHMVAING